MLASGAADALAGRVDLASQLFPAASSGEGDRATTSLLLELALVVESPECRRIPAAHSFHGDPIQALHAAQNLHPFLDMTGGQSDAPQLHSPERGQIVEVCTLPDMQLQELLAAEEV